MWDASSGKKLKRMEGHTGHVRSVAFSSDGKWIVSGSDDRSVRVWDASSGEELKRMEGHTSHVQSVAFSPDGKWIVSGSSDHSVRVWDTSSGEEFSSESNTSSVQSVALSFDNKGIVPGSIPRITWGMNNDRWILMQSFPFNKLMWMPQFLGIAHDPASPTKLIISRNGCSAVDFQNCQLGTEWANCYVSQSAS